MLPDWVSNSGPLTYESGALPIALRAPGCLQGGLTLKCAIIQEPHVQGDHPMHIKDNLL